MTRGKRPRTASAGSHSKKPWEAVGRQEGKRGEEDPRGEPTRPSEKKVRGEEIVWQTNNPLKRPSRRKTRKNPRSRNNRREVQDMWERPHRTMTSDPTRTGRGKLRRMSLQR